MSRTDPTEIDASHASLAGHDWNVEDLALIQTAMPISDEDGELEASSDISAIKAALPSGIFQIAKNKVSGRYRGKSSVFQLELRIDVDGSRPMKKISGDFYSISGATTSYNGSFIVESPTLKVTNTLVTIQGKGKFTWNPASPLLKVTIPRTIIFQNRAAATVQFLSANGSAGAQYICPFESIYFRTVRYEQDWVSDVTTPVFSSYNTGSLPSGGAARTLSVAGAYAECGIEMQNSGVWNKVSVSESGSNLKWSDSELHAAMLRHFSMWSDTPQWIVWLLVAQNHEDSGLAGIMFDVQGKHRQGCAVFHRHIGGTSADKLRYQLFCYVHELGHCFNLLHAWQKNFSSTPSANRPGSLSWMNYPQYWPVGYLSSNQAAFWNQFAFQFDDLELVHLRHAFRNNIILGGNDFGSGAALSDSGAFASPIEDNSGLKVELRAKDRFALGEPVVVEVKLSTTDTRGVTVHSRLHPKDGFVHIAICKPNGQVAVYEPLMEQCLAENDLVKLDGEKPSIYSSAFISYGKGGLYFDQPGWYELRALYYSSDGSLVTSGTLRIRVSAPYNSTDEELADLFMGDEQGTLLYLLGSDSEFLKKGNSAFDKVLTEYGDHPLAVYARLVRGFNGGRAFKSITDGKKITFRPPAYEDAVGNLTSVVESSEKGKGVDNITLQETMLRMAENQKAMGTAKDAKETMDWMVDIFSKKSLKPHIMRSIKASSKKI